MTEYPIVNACMRCLHQPWQLTPMEQQMYAIQIGIDYPKPIIDFEISAKAARDKLWAFQKRDDVQAEGRRILKRHTLQIGLEICDVIAH